jgi:cytochrome c oxidase subunit 2
MRRCALLALVACVVPGACERESPQVGAKGAAESPAKGITASQGVSESARSPALSDDAKKVELGKALHITAGCNVCHSVDGTKAQGPTMKGVFGSTVRLSDGTTIVADEAYMKRSILDPMAEIVDGYPPQMLPYQGVLSDEKIDALIAYYKTLGAPAPAAH